MKKYSLFIIGIIALMPGIFGITTSKTKDSDEQLAEVDVNDFDIRVNTIGVLDTARSRMIASTVRGDKGKIIYLIEDGTKVGEGDVLVRLDPTPFEEEVARLTGEVLSRESAVDALEQVLEWEKSDYERQIETAEFNLKAAELELEKIQKGEGPLQLAQFKGEMDKANQEYTRYASYLRDLEDLREKGYSQQSEITQAKERTANFKEAYELAEEKYLNYKNYVLPSVIETAKTKVKKANMELEQTKKEGVFKIAKAMAELKKARHELEAAKTALQQAKDELDKTIIRAPISGIAILYETFRDAQKRKPRIGDTVWQNQPLLYLPDISSMIVKTQVREVDLYKITTGQKVSVRVDAYPDALFEGEVTSIGVLADAAEGEKGGEKYFQFTVSIKGEDARLKPGMTARLSIQSSIIKNALTIPIHAVFNEGGRRYCYVSTEKGFEKIEVAIGKQNEDRVEILSGLKRGDRISLVKPAE